MKKALYASLISLCLVAPTASALDWTIEPVGTTGDLGWGTGLGVGADGAVYAASYQSAGTTFLRTRNPVSNSWGTASNFSGDFNDFAVDHQGRPHLLYRGASGAKLAILDDNGVWQTSNLPATSATSLSIDFDSQNRPHIGYIDTQASTLKCLSWNGAGWDSRNVVTAAGMGYSNSFGNIALDNNDALHAIWYDFDANMIKHRNWNGSSYSTRNVGVGFGASMEFDAQNNLHLAFNHYYSRDLQHAIFDGSAWTFDTVDNGNADEGALTLDASGNPHFVYGVDRAAGPGIDKLRYASWDGSQWACEEIDQWKSDYNGSEEQSIAIVNNRVHILYSNDSKNLFYATAYIPEPATLMLAALGGIMVLRRRP